MPKDLPVVWFPSLEKLTRELNLELSKGRVIQFHNQYSGLVKDPKKPLVYLLDCEWVSDNNPQRSIGIVFGYEEPFFSVEENCPEQDKCGEIGWAREKPFGMSFHDNSFTFDYNSIYAATIIEMSGEFPNLKYRLEKRICWGQNERII